MPDAAAEQRVLVRDRGLLWHPYAMLGEGALYEVADAAGVRMHLIDADGRHHEAIDAMSSWWSAIHGYRNAALDAAIRRQTARFSHVMFGGLTHEPAVRLAERLVKLAPGDLSHVFFADSGSVAVEVALKLALQYQRALGRSERRRIAALRGGYHGDTSGAMSVCDPIDGMHTAFSGHLARQLFLPRPPAAAVCARRPAGDAGSVAAWAAEVEDILAREAHTLAAIIVEPVLQGAGGMRPFAPESVAVLRRLADQHGLLLIADEIATGFGRTGRLFAMEWTGVTPDLMCVGKALTGGYVSLAALLCTTEVADVLERSRQPLLHGPTFMANPLACAIADAAVEELGHGQPVGSGLDGSWHRDVLRVEDGLRRALAPAEGLDAVREVRVLGAVGVLELDRFVDAVAVTRAAVARGVWLRPFRNLVYAMPPYRCTTEEAELIGRVMTESVAEVHA